MKMLNEIAKSIYNEIQLMVENGCCPSFLNFLFKDGEFVEYIFTDDIFDSTCDEGVWGGVERTEYVNMSVKNIEDELYFTYQKSVK